jgi:hypothetical protein
MAGKKRAAKERGIAPRTMTAIEAAKRHPGTEERHFARMCLKGEAFRKKYGSIDKVPPAESRKALFAVKVGRGWQIPVEELDRVFLP